ncbi:hypothetical protein ACFL3G_07470 [Planctomycetota bacterium]
MATEDQKIKSQEQAQETVPDNDLFAEQITEDLSAEQLFADSVYEELSAEQIFTGELAYLEKAKVRNFFAGGRKFSGRIPRLSFSFDFIKRISLLQAALLAGIVLIAVLMVYAIVKPSSVILSEAPSAPLANQTYPTSPNPIAQQPVQQVAQRPIEQAIYPSPRPEPVLDPRQPLSLEIAQEYYLQADYDKAYAVYDQLSQNLSTNVREEPVRDFLHLQMALCLKETGALSQADSLLKTVSRSRSLGVKIAANYYRSLVDIQKERYLGARTRAYRVLALIESIDVDAKWAQQIQRDSFFIAAESITRMVLSLSDSDKDLPEELWRNPNANQDMLATLNESQLRIFLNSGTEQLNEASLSPKIKKVDTESSSRFSVVCDGASIEELMARFASNASLDVHWSLEQGRAGILKRPVSIYLPAAMKEQAVSVAAGCVGLLAQLDEKGVVTVSDLDEYSYVSQYTSLLNAEASSLWQKFLLTYHNDPQIANIHFALGLLHSQKGRVDKAIAEYKLVANRFSKTSLAQFALFNSSKLKNSLLDHTGAHRDLKQLVEQYPDSEIIGQAYLDLADTMALMDVKAEAARLYRKIYNLNLSDEFQGIASLGAGRCFYEIGDFDSATKWLSKHILMEKDRQSKNLYSAYYLLGKTNLASGNIETACNAFQNALDGQLSKDEYCLNISSLVDAYLLQDNYVQALQVLEDAHSSWFSQKESIEIFLLKSKAFRGMGLVDNAIAMLGERSEYIKDSQLKAKIVCELSDCYIDKGKPELAHKKLSEILISAEPGPWTHKVALKLADVYMKSGNYKQVESVCSQLLDLKPSGQIKRKALEMLAISYNQQQNYDKAALALWGRWK